MIHPCPSQFLNARIFSKSNLSSTISTLWCAELPWSRQKMVLGLLGSLGKMVINHGFSMDFVGSSRFWDNPTGVKLCKITINHVHRYLTDHLKSCAQSSNAFTQRCCTTWRSLELHAHFHMAHSHGRVQPKALVGHQGVTTKSSLLGSVVFFLMVSGLNKKKIWYPI